MKICFDYEIFWKQKISSIGSRYYFNLIDNLFRYKELNIKVFAGFYLDEKIENLSKNVVFGKKIKKKIPLTGKITEKFNSVFCNYKISNFNPDIIHKTYYSNRLIKNKSKVVLTVMDLWHEKNSNYKDMPKKDSIDIADHIICPSNYSKKDLIDIYKVDEKKVSVVSVGIENFEKCKNNNFTKHSDKPYLLYVGARGRYKNFNSLIEAFSSSTKLKNDFNILCFGGGNFTSYEQSLFKEKKISHLVIKSERIDDQALYNTYKNARCLIYPSSHEGIGLPPLEAMSLECPVITSNHEAILEGVGNAGVIFNPSSIEDIKDKIENTVYSNDKIKELKINGIIRSKNFSWKKCAEETIKIYRNF